MANGEPGVFQIAPEEELFTGSQPGSLPSRQIAEFDAANFLNTLGQAPPPQPAAAPPEETAEPAEPAAAVPTEAAPAPPEEPAQPPVVMGGEFSAQEFLGSLEAKKPQIRPAEASFIERFQGGAAVTDNEFLSFWQKKYGDDTAKMTKEGKRLIRRNTDQSFIEFDPEEFEIFKDTLGDWSRLIIETGAAVATEVGIRGAATAAGFGVGGFPGAAAAFVASEPVAGAAGGFVAQVVGDAFSEFLIGIERDPERLTRGQEQAISTGLGAAFGAASRAIKNYFQKHPGAKQFVMDMMAKGRQHIDDYMREVLAALDSLNKLGLNKEGEKIVLAPHQLTGRTKTAVIAKLKDIFNVQGFQDWQQGQAKLLEEAFFTLTHTMGILDEKTAKRLLAKRRLARMKGKPVKGEPGFADFKGRLTQSVDNFMNQEGKIIEKAKAEAGKAMTNNPVKVDGTLNTSRFRTYPGEKVVDSTAKATSDSYALLGLQVDPRVGVTIKGAGEGVALKRGELINYLSRRLQIKPSEAAELMKLLNGTKDVLFNQGNALSPKQLEAAVNSWSLFAAKKSKNNNVELVKSKMLSSLRADRRLAVTQNLGSESAKATFINSMRNYTRSKKYIGLLADSLGKNPMDQLALMNNIFEAANGSEKAKALRGLLKNENPQLWHDMVTEWFDSVLDANRGEQGRVAWDNVSKHLLKNEETLNAMLEGSYYTPGQFKDFLKVSKQISENWVDAGPEVKMGLTKKILQFAFTPFISTKLEQVGNLLKKITGDDKVMAYLKNNTEGIINSMETAEGKSRARIFFRHLSRGFGQAVTLKAPIEDVGRETVETLTREEIRQIPERIQRSQMREQETEGE